MPSKQPKKSEEVPNLVISGPENASHMPFQRSRNVMARNSAKQKARRCRRCTTGLFKTTTYELRARPNADPSKNFGCVIKADHDTDKLAFLMDDYAQYRFKNQREEPFLEIFQKSTDLRGAARSSRIPHVLSRLAFRRHRRLHKQRPRQPAFQDNRSPPKCYHAHYAKS